ncbi:MAG: DUF4397 domain-containing protein [Bacteroidota bacterium]
MKKQQSIGRWAIISLSILLISIAFTSCKKTNNDNNEEIPAAGLMAFNLAPGTVSGFAVSGNSITASPLFYGSFTGGYIRLFPGDRTIQAYDYNTGSNLANKAMNLERDKYYSAFLVGTSPNFQQIVVRDNIDSLASASQSFVRYINAIPDASSPTVTISNGGENVVNQNAAFTSVSEFVVINPGDVTITVNNGGNINATRTVTLQSQKIYTILLSGKPGGIGDEAVQIKYIQNGTVDDLPGMVNPGAADQGN